MISFISGKVILKNKASVAVLTSGGVGYEVVVSAPHLSKLDIGQEIDLFAYLKVSDSNLELYGFQNAGEREFFCILLSVSGVGPKSAMSILSIGSIDKIKDAIARGDSDYLSSVHGIGKKTAERMIVELKSKIVSVGGKQPVDSGALGEVVEGLVSLGYSRGEARDAVQSIEDTNKTSEELMRIALQKIK